MKTLSIDCASHEGHIACVDDAGTRAIRAFARANDAELVPFAEDALARAGWKKEDVERVACNLGPGGFTSVRNGVAFANALSDLLGVPAAGYHGSVLALARTGAALWVHSTRRDEAFVLGGPWAEPTLVPIADVLAAVRGTTVAGDLLDAHRAAILDAGAAIPPALPLESVLPGLLAGLQPRGGTLVPWYGRGI
jgi:tRNA A37 threonylcarbamoyladenosine modification protein TsaB